MNTLYQFVYQLVIIIRIIVIIIINYYLCVINGVICWHVLKYRFCVGLLCVSLEIFTARSLCSFLIMNMGYVV